MHLIISSIGSITHKLGKAITKLLNPFIETISPSCIKNSGNLFEKLRGINMSDKLSLILNPFTPMFLLTNA